VGRDAVFAAKGGRVFLADGATGRPRWTFRAREGLESSPVVSGGTVFVGAGDGRLYALDLRTGRQTWRYPTGGAITGSPAVSGGRLLIGSEDGTLYCFGG
jgi:outer membrane protein assembly factor BamB